MTEQYNPYQAPSAYEIPTDDVEYEYAGFWIRVGATLIDTVLVVLVVGVLGFVLGMLGLFDPNDSSVFDAFLNIAFVVLYIFLWVKFAGTPGHRWLKLKILDADTGEHLTVGRAIIRYIGYVISGIVLGIGYIWVAFDKKKQGWHDKMANSVVVKEL